MGEKLDAVNTLLDAIGETPVQSLPAGLADADAAERFLDRTTRDVLEIGWHCNTDLVTLNPDVNQRIALPGDTLQVKTVNRSRFVSVTERVEAGIRYLFDVRRQSYLFERPVEVQIIRAFPFENLPHALRRYITAHASLLFQADTLGSNVLDATRKRDRDIAWAALQDAEGETEDANMLEMSPDLQWTNRRTYGRRWL